jgi:hypothetical protein
MAACVLRADPYVTGLGCLDGSFFAGGRAGGWALLAMPAFVFAVLALGAYGR